MIQKLRQNGYIVHSNIGSSNCKVDIGVVSENGKSYRLGILLDHGGCSDPVDRETIVPRILKNKGWNLYRLRSVDWHQNPDYEWKKLMASLN